MRFRRRRKAAVVWLPNVGTKFNQDGAGAPNVNENPSETEFIVDVTAAGPTPATVSVPLVLDNPNSVAETGAPLDVIQKQGLQFNADWGYRLRRIVADYYVGAAPTNLQGTNLGGIAVHLGIIIRRVFAEDGTATAPPQQQDVNTLENNKDPWIWRRSFILSEGIPRAGDNLTSQAIEAAPQSNIGYGVAKYMNIDQKTVRRVGPEERLFLTATFFRVPYDEALAGAALDNNWRIYFHMSYRCLAQRVQAMMGNKRNATR